MKLQMHDVHYTIMPRLDCRILYFLLDPAIKSQDDPWKLIAITFVIARLDRVIHISHSCLL